MTEASSNAPERTAPRLTVVRASGAERRQIASRISCPVVDADGVAERAEAVATERTPARVAAHNRAVADRERAADALTLALGRAEQLQSRQQALRVGAGWAAEADAEVAAARVAVAEAEGELEARLAAQRSALASLDRVLEQRATANAAMSDAELRLSDLGVAEMDESGLRRELEASGHAVRSAHMAHAEAVTELASLERSLADVVADEGAVSQRLAEIAPSQTEGRQVVAVQAAFERWEAASALAVPDPRAAALADAWTDLQADLASVAEAEPLPDPAAIGAAERRVVDASQHLAVLEAATGSGPLSDEARAEIDAAHEAVLAAEERSGRRLGGAAARRELERAREQEADILGRHGFASHIDVVLTGGRARHDSPELFQAARAYRTAVAERDAFLAASRARPELAYLDGERARLHRHCTDLLGVDPGDAVVSLLRAHPEVSVGVVEDLRDALDAVGVRPIGMSLPDAAATWLAANAHAPEQRAQQEQELDGLRARLSLLVGERARLEEAVPQAQRQVAEAAEIIEKANRSVSAFESELSMRADEDARRLQRFAAAEQLRVQIEALATTLATAEGDARRALEQAASAVVPSEAALDRATARLSDLSRRARSLVAELPTDRRPEGDPLLDLDAIAQELTLLADGLAGELEAAAALRQGAARAHADAVAEAEVTEAAIDGPLPEDRLDALRHLLVEGDRLLVLDDPFDPSAGVPGEEARDLLLEAAVRRPVVLLTEDADLLGWAIELPPEVGRIVSVDALNLDAASAEEMAMDRAVLELSHQPVASDAAHAPTPQAPRWAGRR